MRQPLVRDPAPGERFELEGTRDVGVVAEVVLAATQRKAPRWLVRTADGALWRICLRDGSLTRGPRYVGRSHWTGPRG